MGWRGWWIGCVTWALLGCGGAARQAKRAEQMRRAPGPVLVLTRARVEPVDMPCGGTGPNAAVRAWRETSRAVVAAGKTKDPLQIHAAMRNEAAARAALGLAFAEFQAAEIDVQVGPDGHPPEFLLARRRPACRHAFDFNRRLLGLARAEQAFVDALEAYQVSPKAGNPPAEEPAAPDYIGLAKSLQDLMTTAHADQAAYLTGWAYTEAGRPIEARAAFNQIGDDSPRAAEVALRIGLIDAEAGAHELAIAAFDRALRLDRDAKFSPYARYFRARSRYVLGEIEPAVRDFIALASSEHLGPDSARTGAFMLAAPWDGAPSDAARIARFLPGDSATDARIMRRTLESLLARDRFALVRSLGESARTRFTKDAALPGILRAWIASLQRLDPSAALQAQASITTWLSEPWLTAQTDPAALRAATTLIDESLTAASQADQAPVAVEALRSRIARRIAPMPALHRALAERLAPTDPLGAVLAWGAALDEGAEADPALRAGLSAAFSRVSESDPRHAEAQAVHARIAPPPGHPLQHGTWLARHARHAEAMALWVAQADADPQGEYAPQMLFNAAVSAERIGRLGTARRLYGRIVADHPASALAAPSLIHLGALAERLLDFDAALATYRQYSARYPDGEHARDAAVNTVLLLRALGRRRAAAEAAERLARRFQGDPEAPRFLLLAADAYQAVGEPERARAALSALLRGRPAVDVRLDALARRARLEPVAAAATTWTQVARLAERAPRDLPGRADLLAEAQFNGIEPDLRRWRLRMTQWPKGSMRALVRAEHAATTALIGRYTRVVSLRSARWSLASLYRMGEIHAGFAAWLRRAPVPPGTEAGALPAWRRALGQQAQPIRQKAIEAWRLLVRRSAELGLDDVWVERARAGLCRLATCPLEGRLAPIPSALTAPLPARIEGAVATPAAQAAQAALTAAIEQAAAGDEATASATLDRAAARFPQLAEAHLARAILAERAGADPRPALAAARATGRRAGLAAWIEGLAALRAGRPPGAGTDRDVQVRAALQTPSTTHLEATRARFLAAPADPQARLNQLRAVLWQRPTLADPLVARAEEGAEVLDLLAEATLQITPRPAGARLAQAALLLERAVKAPGGAPAATWARLGAVRMRLGRVEQARAAFDAALRRRPGWLPARLGRAVCQGLAGDPVAADAALAGIDHPIARLNRGLIALAADQRAAARAHLAAYRAALGDAVDPAFERWWRAAGGD